MDKRHARRIAIIRQLYAQLFNRNPTFKNLLPETLSIFENIKSIDEYINEFAFRYGTDKIAKIDLSILRLAIWELMFDSKKNPPKVIINEAIELAKEFGAENSSSFVNAILGQIYKKYYNEK